MWRHTMHTEQMNMRLTPDLKKDLDIVACLLKVNRSEWVKTKLAEEIHKEKNRLLMELSTLYAKGMVTKKNIEKLVGKDIADEMEFVKKKSIASIHSGRELGRKLKGKLSNKEK
jgi:hypothetical protein